MDPADSAGSFSFGENKRIGSRLQRSRGRKRVHKRTKRSKSGGETKERSVQVLVEGERGEREGVDRKGWMESLGWTGRRG